MTAHLTAPNARVLLRIAHIALGACLAVVVYAPTTWTDPLRFVLGAVVVPTVALTGLALWQQGRLRRLVGQLRHNPPTPNRRGP